MAITSKNGNVILRLNAARDVWEKTVLVTRHISRDELFCLVSRNPDRFLFDLTPEEEVDILDWNSQPIKLETEARFISKGFTWHEMEQWIASCYRMRVNPLSSLRRILEDVLPDAVYYEEVFEGGSLPDPHLGLTCIQDMRQLPMVSVTLLIHGTFEELSAERAARQRMLKDAGIH